MYIEKPSETRKATNRLLELVEDYTLDPNDVVLMCVKWMSEDDVRAMMIANEIDLGCIDDEEEEDEATC